MACRPQQGNRCQRGEAKARLETSQRLTQRPGFGHGSPDTRVGQHFGQQFQPIVALRDVPGRRINKEIAGQTICGSLFRWPEKL